MTGSVSRGRLALRCSVVAVLLASAGLLSACSPIVGSPLTAADRAAVRSAILASAWRDVSAQYPEALRPEVVVSTTLADHEWRRQLVLCLRDRGITARLAEGQVTYSSSNGQPPLEVAVSFYSCTMSHPSVAVVQQYLDDAQSYALHNYYLNSVRPCLIAAGVPSPLPRLRSASETLSGLPVPSSWNPYEIVSASKISPVALGALEQRCPPIPAWLNLGSN